MQRMIVVVNSRSSRAGLVEAEVLSPLRNLKGMTVGKYKVLPIDVEENVSRLAKILRDGDLVVAVGGDATALIALNGCMESAKDVVFAALPFGNFNDTAATLGGLNLEEIVGRYVKGETKRFYPLDVGIDGRHFRYAVGYVTIGMFAEATEIFVERGGRRMSRSMEKILSYVKLAKWYFGNRKHDFLPGGMTDYVAVNGRKMGGVMRGDSWFLRGSFLFGEFKLDNIVRLGGFMMKAMLARIPGKEVMEKKIDFDTKTRIVIQTEGESREVECEKIEIKKSGSLKVVMR